MTYYKKGATNVICDRCGFKKKSTECKMQWNNLFVCADGCWEPRHPMDLFNPDLSESTPEITRPEPGDIFVSVSFSNDSFNNDFNGDFQGGMA